MPAPLYLPLFKTIRFCSNFLVSEEGLVANNNQTHFVNFIAHYNVLIFFINKYSVKEDMQYSVYLFLVSH